MDNTAVYNMIGYVILIGIFLGIAYAYVSNALKAIKRLNNREIGFMTIFRVIGIFFPVIGVVLGLVKD
jgi:H+/Cl- antiporter ClcA